MKADNDQRGSSNAQLSTQIQSLNDSVDELKTRIANLTTQVQAIQSQMQNVNGMPAQPGGAPGAPANQGPGGQAGADAARRRPRRLRLTSSIRALCATTTRPNTPLRLLNSAMSIHYYPQDPLAGNAQFYLGEISYRQGKFAAAVKYYDAVLEQYSGTPRLPPPNCARGNR